MECPASLMAKSYFIQNGNFVCTRNKVGEGAYGVVYSGRYRDKQCALKYIRSYLLQSASARVFSMDQFERECEMTHRLSSPYIVRFLGVSFHRNVPVLLAELLECSLTDVLGCQHCSVPYHREIDIALGIARGIHFLHCQTPPVVHRDLSSNNVLMASDYRVKIADLGVAKSMDNRFCSTMPGTLPYMPPEVHQPTELSVAIDLFSFAVLMVQLETRKSPNPGDQMERVPSQEGGEGDGESRRGVAIPQRAVEGDSGQYRVRPECERRRDHIELMDPSGVLHRIVHCYLVDEPRGRRRTPLTEVTRWLEQETQTPRYTDSVKENPETPLEHRTANHSPRRAASAKPAKAKKEERTDDDSGIFSHQNTSNTPHNDWEMIDGRVPSDTSGRGLLYTVGRLASVMGLTSVDEDDEEYKQRVVGSL